MPPPRKSPFLATAAAGQTEGSAKRPSATVPNTPLARWTAVAPTGSSIPTRSKKKTARTTRTPATSPMTRELGTLTKAHGAVMATSPARQPFSVMPKSGFPRNSQAAIMELTVAAAAATFVVVATWAMDGPSAAIVEPGLNPNQPNHRTSTPMAAEVMLCPGRAFTFPPRPNFPMRGPRTMTPARAAQPPTEWTTVEPAKSRNPLPASQPPPQIRCPPTG